MRKRLPILIILLLGAAGFAWQFQHRPVPVPVQRQEKAWPVSVAVVHPARLAPQLTLYGRVASPRYARLSAAVDADVAAVEVLAGEPVRGGQLLVRLDDREAQLTLAQRRADVAELQAELDREAQRQRNDLGSIEHERRLLELTGNEAERARKLAERSVGSRARLDQALLTLERQTLTLRTRELAIAEYPARRAAIEARLARARAALSRARIDLARTLVNAPFDGRVTAVAVAAGDHVRVGVELLGVYDTAALEIRAQIPLRHLAAVRRHLATEGALDARARVDGVTVEARLERIAAEIEPGSAAAEGYFRVIAGGAGLSLGRIAALVVDLPVVDGVVALPYDAIYGGDHLFVNAGGRLGEVSVERIGERRNDAGIGEVLVRSDALSDGTEVVLTQLPNAIDGLLIRVVD